MRGNALSAWVATRVEPCAEGCTSRASSCFGQRIMGNQSISTSIDIWFEPIAVYRSNTGSHKNRGAGCEAPLPFDMRFEMLLFNALEQAARACTRKTFVGRAPGSSGFQGAIGPRNRTRQHIDIHQCTVNEKARNAGAKQLRNLWGGIELHAVIQMATAVEARPDGQHAPVDVLELEVAGAQAAVRAIVDAGAGDLQDAVLARHDAGCAEHHEAQRHFAALRGDAFDFGERELG